MKAAKISAVVLIAGVGVYALGRAFVTELGRAPRAAEPQAVLFTAPAGFAVEDLGESSRSDAARQLALRVAGDSRPLGVHFIERGSEIFWLVERGGAGARIVERVAGPSGTRVETVYGGALDSRLAWASDHGGFDAPGAPAAESRNLYH